MLNYKGNSKSVTSILAKFKSGGLFGGFCEKALLNKLLNDPGKGENFPFAEARDVLVKLNSTQQQVKAQKFGLHASLKPEYIIPDPSEEAKLILQRAAVTSKDLDIFLKTNYLSSVPQAELQEFINRGILDMLGASTPNNLRTLMHYLSKYWQVGLFGVRPTISQARLQAKALLMKAIDIHPRTVNEGGGEQTGIPDFNKFKQFVDKFFTYMKVHRSPTDELNALLLRFCASSGSIKDATALVMERPHIDEYTLETYLSALSIAHKTADTLESVKPMLLNEHTGPTAVLFLLPYCQTLDELMYVLEVVDRSSRQTAVYEQCQGQILKTLKVVDCRYSVLAVMFGVLHRIKRYAALTPDTLNTAIDTALQFGNISAVKKLLDLSKHSSSAVQRANECIQAQVI